MNKIILALSSDGLLLVLTTIFVLLFVIILKSLKQVSIFGKKTTIVISLCVSLLCIIGLNQTFAPILLLYAALAIALLLSPFLWFIAKIFHGDKRKKKSKQFNHRPQKYYLLSDFYKSSVERDEDRFTK